MAQSLYGMIRCNWNKVSLKRLYTYIKEARRFTDVTIGFRVKGLTDSIKVFVLLFFFFQNTCTKQTKKSPSERNISVKNTLYLFLSEFINFFFFFIFTNFGRQLSAEPCLARFQGVHSHRHLTCNSFRRLILGIAKSFIEMTSLVLINIGAFDIRQ